MRHNSRFISLTKQLLYEHFHSLLLYVLNHRKDQHTFCGNPI